MAKLIHEVVLQVKTLRSLFSNQPRKSRAKNVKKTSLIGRVATNSARISTTSEVRQLERAWLPHPNSPKQHKRVDRKSSRHLMFRMISGRSLRAKHKR